jgi:hypothetical protein
MKENIGDRLWKSQLFSGRCDIGEAQVQNASWEVVDPNPDTQTQKQCIKQWLSY